MRARNIINMQRRWQIILLLSSCAALAAAQGVEIDSSVRSTLPSAFPLHACGMQPFLSLAEFPEDCFESRPLHMLCCRACSLAQPGTGVLYLTSQMVYCKLRELDLSAVAWT